MSSWNVALFGLLTIEERCDSWNIFEMMNWIEREQNWLE